MAQPFLGLRVLHSHGAGGRGFLGDWLPGFGCGYRRCGSCDSPPTSVAGSSALAAAAVLYLLRRVWLGADLYPAAVAALLLQLSIRNGDAACARTVRLSCGAGD